MLFSCSVVSNSATPWTTAHQASLSFTISQSLLKLMFIESVIPSNHLIPPRRAPLRPLAALAPARQLLLDVAHGARLGGAPGSRRLRGLCGEWMREVTVCIIRSSYRRGRGSAGAGAGSRAKPGGAGPPLAGSRAVPAPLGEAALLWTPGVSRAEDSSQARI